MTLRSKPLFRFYVDMHGEAIPATRNGAPLVCNEDELMNGSPRTPWQPAEGESQTFEVLIPPKFPDDAVTVLLHQFSEWLDTYPAEDDETHDDLVRVFLAQRSPDAFPRL